MKTRKLSLLLITTLLLFILVTPALAQTYAFSLDKETIHAIWESDGTLTLTYEFVFTNATYADPIDYVDVGMPNDNYYLSDIYAEVNGEEIYGIGYSAYVDGIELYLGIDEIDPGETGTVRVAITGIEGVLYTDSTDDNYASAVFSPTWFGSEYVSGSTDLTMIYHLPPGVQPEEPRWHRAPSGFPDEPETSLDEQGRVMYIWRNRNANGHTQYLFGASFPAQYVPASAIATPTIWQRLGIDPETFWTTSFVCGFIFLMFGIPVLSIRSARKRRMKYLPPKVSVSGNGIKRGLTAIEAAILLEQPMDKILTMILFAVIKKGAATVEAKDPLKLKIAAAPSKGLRSYETDFLEAMNEDNKAKRRKALQKAMVALIRSVSRKMKGFSAKDTRNYYEKIMEKAWAQVEAAGTPEMRSEKYNEVMEWTMLDKDYDDRTQDVFRHHPVYVPTWWHRYDPTYTRSGPSAPRKTSAPASRPTPGGAGLPHLPGSDFAASVVNGTQSFAAGVIGSVQSFTSGVTKTTNPVPVSTSSGSSGGSSGGSSCACACACAGCACACAGGGR